MEEHGGRPLRICTGLLLQASTALSCVPWPKAIPDRGAMDFRYCSKCAGYYCYCANHINNHQHVQ